MYKADVKLWVLSRLDYIINDYGFQCFKKLNFKYKNQSMFFTKEESFKQFDIKLSRLECMALVESKMCGNNAMSCNDNGCFYSSIPNGPFVWNTWRKYESVECKFHKKLLIGDKLNSWLFSFNLSSCRPNDLFC